MAQELRFDGRVVVVTGAGAGLGRTYALLFASRGASIVVNDLGGSRHGDGSSTKSADAVVQEIQRNGGKAVANYDSVLDGAKIIKTAIDTFGRVDVVVNNAGILRDVSFGKMTEAQWDVIHNVHLKGAMKTTQAAWPYFMKQQYGRVIFTSSNSGVYGNFGQSNYSSAKLGLVGLANTLAIEGARKNIYTNVIVPTAASRLTEDIIPPDFFEQLKPELIAPVVFWLCHEDCTENGSIIEAALGWAGKCHIIRSSGCALRQDLSADVTPENVRENWSKVIDMTSTKRLNSVQEATGELIGVLEDMKSGAPSNEVDHVMRTTYNFHDTILYALGVGATVQEPTDIRYLYENHDEFAVLPTFYVLYGPMGCMSSSIVSDALPFTNVDPTRILHGEQFLEVYKRLPAEATVETRFKVQDVMDKGKGAVVLVQHDTYDVASGEKLSTGQISTFIVGSGGFKGKRTSTFIIPTVDPPTRKPDVTVMQQTNVDQAALYRLSGDLNPLHIDPNVAMLGGFKKPILHGLCSLGFSVRHVLQTYAAGDPHLFKSIKVRFAKPVMPGETLRTDMWRNGNRIHFQTTVHETGVPVITGAYIDLLEVKTGMPRANPCSGKTNLESDAIFAAIGDHVKQNPDQAKKVNAVFLYNILVDGKQMSEWTLDLKNGEVHKGKPKSGKADATLIIEDKDMVEIALGKLNPQLAFMRGKLKITGNIMLTQKLKSLMEANKAKL
ncbi:PREDICTED: peroxisomal multifunctional enzyme type 2 [Wasmannia auropunctata]|uniref:peroxisomal multifunctional enzyme type 2 n=1 Tax=Wasmannia auropunctata TaxID=64793 RepID=UPI0005EF505C|nr:PREDICTED: peroxisomal multifunctional enzyme type 2 [Wasmannia auropunctata]XP_011685974.1 PREDICTED: peroxisomal multifunctional enzyme type 2 [Wasmannia auropunctata]XP_011685975.1 PREDICTED: peroxisomal multifunctional enzyme type 2 [Wasmannia auropunctata]